MKIAITGVAGFVGSNLAKKLLSEGHQVYGIDNFSFGNKGNIAPFINNKNFSFYERDARLYDSFKDIKADVWVHLASQKIPRYSSSFYTLNDNNQMTDNLIKKCLEDKSKLVFASTSDVYGKNTELPFNEESNLVMGPTNVKRWAYSVSKMFSEHKIIANHDELGLDYTIMRFFGSYGPNQNTTWWGGPQAVFIQNILEGKTIEIHGNGLQTRTFTFIEDTVQGIEKCIFHPDSLNDVFNIANEPNEEITIKELGLLIWELMKGNRNNPDMKLIPYETFGKYEDVMRRVPDITKIKTKLGFEPKWKMADGLRKTIEWQTELYKKS
ncbi:MAG: GDP-mannose 4,6-dehydratase [Bacteroidetes bacterium]|nr:GDP-mannose 4,6-dehydratase [Bacteroidota bacterium]